uniref:Uncharacterized protein n=1 Tax=Cannabis sativa TaxID=3483 RepID=A0A803PSB7_CANSA
METVDEKSSSTVTANTLDIKVVAKRMDRLESQQAAIILSETDIVNSKTNMRRYFLDSQKAVKEFLVAQLAHMIPLLGEKDKEPQHPNQQMTDLVRANIKNVILKD